MFGRKQEMNDSEMMGHSMVLMINMCRKIGITPEQFNEIANDVHGATEFVMQAALIKLKKEEEKKNATQS